MLDLITDDLQRAVFRQDLPVFGTEWSGNHAAAVIHQRRPVLLHTYHRSPP